MRQLQSAFLVLEHAGGPGEPQHVCVCVWRHAHVVSVFVTPLVYTRGLCPICLFTGEMLSLPSLGKMECSPWM